MEPETGAPSKPAPLRSSAMDLSLRILRASLSQNMEVLSEASEENLEQLHALLSAGLERVAAELQDRERARQRPAQQGPERRSHSQPSLLLRRASSAIRLRSSGSLPLLNRARSRSSSEVAVPVAPSSSEAGSPGLGSPRLGGGHRQDQSAGASSSLFQTRSESRPASPPSFFRSQSALGSATYHEILERRGPESLWARYRQSRGSVHELLELDGQGALLLHRLAATGHTYWLMILLSEFKLRGCELQKLIDARDFDGRTPLRWAAEALQEDQLRILLANRADPRIPDSEGNTVLHRLCHAYCRAERSDLAERTRPTLRSMILTVLEALPNPREDLAAENSQRRRCRSYRLYIRDQSVALAIAEKSCRGGREKRPLGQK